MSSERAMKYLQKLLLLLSGRVPTPRHKKAHISNAALIQIYSLVIS